MKLLAIGRHLRGTAWDPFGRTEVRRLEQSLVREYTGAIRQILQGLTAENFDTAVTTTSAAMNVKGYEALKVASGRALLDVIGWQTPPIPET